MQLRAATEHDAPRIKALIDLYVPDGTLLPRPVEFIAARAHDFVVADAGREGGVVGCAHLDEYSPTVAELRSLAVAPEFQGRGVGRAIVGGVERLARKRDHRIVFAVSNDEAFFARFGYRPEHVPELDLDSRRRCARRHPPRHAPRARDLPLNRRTAVPCT
jgi:amino-acid N-acetyltransferase